MKELTAFCERTKAFDNNSRLKAVLFSAVVKPNTYVHLRITDNLHDKHRFEDLLRKNRIPFSVSRAKGFEEITKVDATKATWKMAGMWYGYDLFRDRRAQATFKKAVELVRARKHAEADELLGKHYGYPPCCVRKFIAEHDPAKIAKKYSAREYFGKLHAMDRAFPFLTHTPCSVSCAASKTLNKKYAMSIKKHAPRFYKKYSSVRKYRMPIVVDEENSLVPFKRPDAHDYIVITMKQLEGNYRLVSWLSDSAYRRGTVLDAQITLQYDYADITPRGAMKKGTGFRHERHFTRL